MRARGIKGIALAVVASLGAATFACSKLTTIDGSTVAKIGSDAAPPTCDQACGRVAALCGYEPIDCRANCKADVTAEWRVCLGQAPACRNALEDCVPPTPEDAGEGEDAPLDEDAAPDEDAADDAGTEDAAGDAEPESGDASDAGSADAHADAAG